MALAVDGSLGKAGGVVSDRAYAHIWNQVVIRASTDSVPCPRALRSHLGEMAMAMCDREWLSNAAIHSNRDPAPGR